MRTNHVAQRTAAALLTLTFTLTVTPGGASAQVRPQTLPRPSMDAGAAVYTRKLPHGAEATIYANGVAKIVSKDHRKTEYRLLPGAFNRYLKSKPYLTDRDSTTAQLALPNPGPYVSDRVLVVFNASAGVAQDVYTVPSATMAALRKRTAKTATASVAIPNYTSDYRLNRTLAQLGVDKLERIGRTVSRASLQASRALAASRRTQTASAAPLLDLSQAYRVHLTGASVVKAVRALKGMPSIAYVGPDYTVRTMNAPAVPIPQSMQKEALVRRSMAAASSPSYTLPKNYAVNASAQPFLNASGVNAVAAFDEIARRYGQLPGQGVRITNVSVGDLDDASVQNIFSDPCSYFVGVFGPTTRMIGGQRYLDLPSMPLIPAYTATPDGTVSGSDEVCGLDPILGEIGLDFSVMAPLPHDQQRGENMGSGFSDLMGIAPGASYRLVVPKSAQPSTSDLIGAFLGAANQTPAPDVITASIGFGMDAYGFPGRYFEDDPLVSSTISQIVNGKNIVVVISANDGTRTYTNASIGPSGGSAATNVSSDASALTTIGDIAFSTVPSVDADSGAIDVGSTTLDDIFALPNTPTVPETRFTGFTAFSSGFGSRVNVSAPGDNIVALTHKMGGTASAGTPVLSGGTSASAPEVAAAAAVLIQVARLTGHPFAKATDVRALLEDTARPVTQAPQSDQPLNVGSQIDLGKAVEKLLAATGIPQKPGVPRVAIAQRRAGSFNMSGNLDTLFVENTDPAYIDLAGPYDPVSQQNSGENALSYITIAPDWEAVPSDAKFALSVTGSDKVLATTPSARLLPADILQAAGMTLASPTQRTVNLTYREYAGLHTVVSTSFQLTFGPAAATSEWVHAPTVDPVVTGPVMNVGYDLSTFPSGMLADPTIIVSFPGRINPVSGNMFFASYRVAVPPGTTKGTISIPVSALQGDGLYGVGMVLNDRTFMVSDFAPVRISTAGATRAQAPVFITQDPTSGAQVQSHYLEMPFDSPFTVAYDVSNVPNATGAMLELSASGSNFWNNNNPFNNPNGSIADSNGYDTGGVYRQVLYGTKGQITLKPADTHVVPSMGQVLRIIPLNGAKAAGEASDVSYLLEDGVVAGDGGTVDGGYGISPQSNEGLLTSYQWMADGNVLKSVQSFKQDTLAGGPVLATNSTGCTNFSVPGNAVFGGDTGLVLSEPMIQCAMSYPDNHVFSGVPDLANATALGSALTFPFPDTDSGILDTSSITGTPTGKGGFLAEDVGLAYGGLDNHAVTFMGDIKSNAFGTPIDLDALNLVDDPIYGPMDVDNSTGLGYIAVDQASFFGWSYPTNIFVTDYTAGTVSTFQAAGCGSAVDLQVDPSTHLAALTENGSNCQHSADFQVLDLSSKFARSFPLPGNMQGVQPGPVSVDPVNHLFFVEAPLSPDAPWNNNALSSILVMDESGYQRAAIEHFNFLTFETLNHYFTINPALRRGFVFGPSFTQIQPFSY